jgi:CubicO group peptidase (beta-lactamase class C family)
MSINITHYFLYVFLVYSLIASCTPAGYRITRNTDTSAYYPPADSLGGWRTLTDEQKIFESAGIDKSLLDSAFEYVRTSTRNGGLLVLRHGWLVYENYFGKGQRDATPNLASCGKSYTSIAVGILITEHPELFPDGLDQKIFTPAYLPQFAFPLSDPAMADIKLGQLLSFSAGIRGNNPVYINGKESSIDPAGPDGWFSMLDSVAVGKADFTQGKTTFSAKTLWCKPGGGYSYASSSIHLAAIILKHITGGTLISYIGSHLASPLGWGTWGYGYQNTPAGKNPGAGGIALRSTDVLRFGYLLLHKGKWGDKQLVPADYIEKATKASPYNPHYPYSLQFNVNTNGERRNIPRDAFWKTGSGGHCIYVVPSLDLVVWKLGGRNDQYSLSNTGIPEPGTNKNVFGPTEKISATLDGNEYAKVLEMIINAIVDKDK